MSRSGGVDRTTGLLCLTLTVAGCFLLLWGNRQVADGLPVTVASLQPGKRATPLAAIPVPSERLAAGAQGQRGEGAPVAAQCVEVASPIQVRGTLLERDSYLPVAGAQVKLVALDAPADAGDAAEAKALTGSGGQFELELDPAVWTLGALVQAGVKLGDHDVFKGPVRLLEDVLVVMRSQVTLHGRVVSNQEISGEEVRVAAHVGRYGAIRVPLRCASGTANADGEFSLSAFVDDLPPCFLITAQVANGPAVVKQVTRSELTSDEGATIELNFGPFECQVVDGLGTPIADARVHLVALEEGSEAIRAATNADGRVSMFAPCGPVEICVGAQGYSSVLRRLDIDRDGPRSDVQFELAALSDQDAIRGAVLFDDGRPVEDAFVSVVPVGSNSELELAGFEARHTDAAGRFELRARSGGGPVRLRAFHRGNGLANEAVFTPDGREVTLWLERRGTVLFKLLADELAGPFCGGPIQFVLAHRTLEASMAGHSWSSPVRLEEVAIGGYNVYIYAPGLGGYGEASVEVTASLEPLELDVVLEPAPVFTGRVVASDGAPVASARVRVRDGGWAPEAAQAFGEATTGSDGSFTLLGGHLGAPVVELLSIPPLSFVLESRDGNVLQLEPGVEVVRPY